MLTMQSYFQKKIQSSSPRDALLHLQNMHITVDDTSGHDF